jgi:hypothetical protein
MKLKNNHIILFFPFNKSIKIEEMVDEEFGQKDEAKYEQLK